MAVIHAPVIIQRDPTGQNVRPKPQKEFNKNWGEVLEMRLKNMYLQGREGRIGMAGACGGKKRKGEKSLGFLMNCIFPVTR